MSNLISSPTVKIEYVGNNLYITPWIPQLESQLVCYRKKATPNFRKSGGLDISYIPEALYYALPDPKNPASKVMITFSGLEKRVLEILENLKYTIIKVDKRPALPDFDPVPLQNINLRSGQREIIEAVLTNYNGTLKGPPALGKTFIIELLCAMYFPMGVKILVSTTRCSVLQEIFTRIKNRVPNAKVSLVDGKTGNLGQTNKVLSDSNIVVCSSKSLHKIEPSWPDLFLYDEVHGAAAPETSVILSQFMGARMFGFSASPAGRSDAADLYIEALFGPVICDIGYKEAQNNSVVAPIEVWMLPVSCPEIIRKVPTSRDRWNIWRNRTRNEKIKEAVYKFKDNTKTLILVNTAEHAFVLKQLLPEFTVVYASLTDDQRKKFIEGKLCDENTPLTLDHSQIRADFRSGKINKVIATTTWREGVDFPDLEVVIRADGTKGPIPATQIGGRLSRISPGKTKGIVIDFTDDFGENYKRRSKNRIQNYMKESWTIKAGYGTV